MAEFHLSVRELAEFCYRSGDIDHRYTPSPSALQGITGHQRVAANRPPSWCSEYSVTCRHTEGDCDIVLRGRADGYDARAGIVEEIKTCRVSPANIPQSIERVHLAQARLYAAMIARAEGCSELEVRLTWFNIDTAQETPVRHRYSAAELADFLADSLRRVSSWLRLLSVLREARDKSLAGLGFPYPGFRPGQRDIAELVYKCVDQGGELLLEAPTGIGKTAAVLYPALKALERGKHQCLVFLTAKSVGRKTAEDTLAHFHRAGYRGVALSMTAKDTICLAPGRACHADECPYARGYYDKLPAAREAAVGLPSLTREDVASLARRHELCPYQLSLDLLPWIDVVIADFHYFYSLTPLFAGMMEEGGRRWTALVDEAHNLPGRARSMYSAGLAKLSLMRARAETRKRESRAVLRQLEGINRAMLAVQKETWVEEVFDTRLEVPLVLLEALRRLVSAIGEAMAAEPAFWQNRPCLQEFFFAVLQFIRVAEMWGPEYRFEAGRLAAQSVGASQSLRLHLNCLDPARLLSARQALLHSLTVFSATLSPQHWVRETLGLADNAVCRRLASPFGPAQMDVTLATGVDTRYAARSTSLPALVDLLSQWVLREQGNCIVYFPSYSYLRDALDLLHQKGLGEWGRTIWVQDPARGAPGREELLHLLETGRDIVAFCILGGVFGEGIDLPGERLCAVVVVGVGMPQVNRDTRTLQHYYQQRYGEGFRYAFLYPGMQKVDQALGRVVRRQDDRGRALLVDTRYSRREYRELLPPWWSYRQWHPG